MFDARVGLAEKVRPDRRAHGISSQRLDWLLAGPALLLGLLIALPYAYWRFVNAVPALPRPPAPPIERNGLVQAIFALNSIPSTAYTREPDDVRYPRVAPLLDRTRAALKQEWSVWRPVGDPLDTDHLPGLGRFLALESRVRRERGDFDGALSSALDAFELALQISRSGGLAARFSGWSCAEYALAEVETLYSDLPVAAIEKHLPRVRRLQAEWPALADAFARERPLAMAACRSDLQRLSRLTFWQQLDAVQSGGVYAGSVGGKVRFYDWKTLGQALVPHSAAIDEVDRHYRGLEAAARSVPDSRTPLNVPVPDNPWVGEYCHPPQLPASVREWPKLSLGLLETAMIVRLDALRRGRLPTSLAEASHSDRTVVPKDVWGRTFQYRMSGGRPVAYSLGVDGTDNGGWAITREASLNGAKGDLVFGNLSERSWRKR